MAENDFQPYATAATANVTDLATWLASQTISNGAVAGYAKSAEINRAIRQPSFVASGLSEWVNEQLGNVPIVDDGNRANYVANLDAALRKLIQSMIRIKATGSVVVYVSGVNGNDNNSGLSSATPFQHIQTAINYMLSNIDLGPHQATIMIEGGQTYNESLSVGSSPLGLLGLGQWQWQTYNGLVSIVGTGSTISLSGGAQVLLNGNFQLSCIQSTSGPNAVIVPISGSRCGTTGSGLIFGNSPGCAHVYASSGGEFSNASGSGSYSIAGGGFVHWLATEGGSIIVQTGIYGQVSINISGTPNFTNPFAAASGSGVIVGTGLSFPGTGCTCQRYSASSNGVINTQGAGASYLPGNAPGFVVSGGQYV